jgi:hypothetical protein
METNQPFVKKHFPGRTWKGGQIPLLLLQASHQETRILEQRSFI